MDWAISLRRLASSSATRSCHRRSRKGSYDRILQRNVTTPNLCCGHGCGFGRLLYSTATGSGVSSAPTARSVATASSSIVVDGSSYATDIWFNTPPHVLACVSRRLHLQPNHPISLTRSIIEAQFPPPTFLHHNDLGPVVTTRQNFDSLGFPADHPGRARSDTYYINRETLLRTHTSAHQGDVFRANRSRGFLISADVYRRDAIDRSHYPVFHQMEGARMWDRDEEARRGRDVAAAVRDDLSTLPTHGVPVEDPNRPFHPERNPLQAESHSPDEAEALAAHLKRSLELMVVDIFTRAKASLSVADPPSGYVDEPLRVRWVEAYFPFTSPSWELEVFYAGSWLEVLGCGVVRQELYIGAGVPSQVGWAFGIGLDRIAMLLFRIPDIRLFWSRDERFLGQFSGAATDRSTPLPTFRPFSKFPPCYKDVSFWLPTVGDGMHENDVMELIRAVAGDLAEDAQRVDDFTNAKTGRTSWCYRITYRSLERTLTNDETNQLHDRVTAALRDRLGVEIR